jgi:hypothetical protein
MSFISISIDICGSTDAKAKLREHSACISREPTRLYDSFQQQVLRVEETFWTMFRSHGLDIKRLFLIKSIGDEVWYVYDLEELEAHDRRATVARMIEALVALQTKHFDLVAGPPEDPYDWENVDLDTLIRIDLPLKITMDIITDALDVGAVREKYLAGYVASLLSPLGEYPRPVQAGNEDYIDLCNRLGIANQVKTSDKVYSSIRSDYIGWEIDRFFRLTKAAIEGGVLIGPEILSDFETYNLLENTEAESQSKAGWSIFNVMIRVCCGPNSFTSLGENYMLARKFLPAKELKGIGAGYNIGIVYFRYQENIKFNKRSWQAVKSCVGNIREIFNLICRYGK